MSYSKHYPSTLVNALREAWEIAVDILPEIRTEYNPNTYQGVKYLKDIERVWDIERLHQKIGEESEPDEEACRRTCKKTLDCFETAVLIHRARDVERSYGCYGCVTPFLLPL